MSGAFHPDVYARLDRVKALWVELAKTPTKSRRYKALVDEIRAEAAAYLAGVEAKGVDRRRRTADRRQHGVDPRQERVDRRRFDRRQMSGPA
jgi:hypothetical protein